MTEHEEWSLLRRLPVSDSVRQALFDAATERRKVEPDRAVTHLAGEIVDAAIRRHLDMGG